MAKFNMHCLALFVELSCLFGFLLAAVYLPFNHADLLMHEHGLAIFALVACGLSAIVISVVCRFGILRLQKSPSSAKPALAVSGLILLAGAILLSLGIVGLVREYPEAFTLTPVPRSAQERAEAFAAVKVVFDVAGGTCSETARVCKLGQTYADNMNLFPSEDPRYIVGHDGTRLHLPTGCFVSQRDDRLGDVVSAGYYTTNAVPFVTPGEKWTYVADVLEFDGTIKDWLVGQTWTTNCNSYTQFGNGRFGGSPRVGPHCTVLTATDYGFYNYLERAVIRANTNQAFRVKFRLSLFAGTSVNESNYRYVRPGETLSCPLPVPTREGYDFDGWYDGERRITEASKVEKRKTHTLKARWHKR